MFGMTQAPSPSVTTVRVNPVSVCVAVTVTPGQHGAAFIGHAAGELAGRLGRR